ncbi:MAG: UDP-GlcNAc--UDP-phosphate GlcNAc-1-phosphate transferase [Dysgonamonadaceae bacterium]|jgi:UDP-N-acetylmuramyl pentapeptide phosphotransferase/UDP-N-acetylglucosamine-1-phosphate transferase|nr:UDP-GlcNAc--UDP-phosphate GlcNAc-1-phosphate transferase [Dysgonamonadaceae bacterium]
MIEHLIRYLSLTILLLAGSFFYFAIAEKFNIKDKPNSRSSHNYITIRGGGIIFWIAGVACSLINLPGSGYFLFGLTLICLVSFWDDISSLPISLRIIVHFISITLIIYHLNGFALPIYWIIVIYIVFTGVMNAFNFMDGINGMTGLYSLTVLLSFEYVNDFVITFTNPDYIRFAIPACLVFLFFNYRRKAICFAGDVGSMGISFWIVMLLLQLMLEDKNYAWVFLLSVYGVDTVLTIIHRIFLRENIFQSHRRHFYQVMTNECGYSHLAVSAVYAGLQLMVSAIVIFVHNYRMVSVFAAVGVLICIYMLKFKVNIAKK